MNINPSAAASVAGTSRAAARGGESDAKAAESTRQSSTAEQPGGKSAESNALDAGDHADDRHGDGRQMLDVFEHSQEDEPVKDSSEKDTHGSSPPSHDGSGEHLDLQA